MRDLVDAHSNEIEEARDEVDQLFEGPPFEIKGYVRYDIETFSSESLWWNLGSLRLGFG